MSETTYGQKAVGLAFNPSNNPEVQRIKELYAEIIDLCDHVRLDTRSLDQSRLLSHAVTEAVGAQMWAVKAITWRD